MKPYITRDVVSLGGGDVVGLDKSQAGPRESFLKEIAPDVYRVTDVIKFKKGEELRFDSVPKRLRTLLAEPGEEEKPPVDLAEENELLTMHIEELTAEHAIAISEKDDVIRALQERVAELEKPKRGRPKK